MSTQSSRSAQPAPLQSLRVMAMALMSGLVVLGVIAALVGGTWDYPAAWMAWVIGGVAVVAYGLCELVGYRAPALAEGTDADAAMRTARAAFQTGFTLRFALCELPALLALVLLFVQDPPSAMTYLIGGVLSLILMAVHVWPGERAIARVERNLDRAGGRSHLSAALGGETPPARGQTR